VFQILKNGGPQQRTSPGRHDRPEQEHYKSQFRGGNEGSIASGGERSRRSGASAHRTAGFDREANGGADGATLGSEESRHLDERFTKLQKEGVVLEELARGQSPKEDDAKLKEQLYKYCLKFRSVLITYGMAVTVRTGEKKSTKSIALRSIHELDYVVYQVCTIVKEAENRGSSNRSGDTAVTKVSQKPKLPARTVRGQINHCCWIVTFVYQAVGGTQPTEVVRMQHNLSLFLRRWNEERKLVKENGLFSQISSFEDFEEEVQMYRKLLFKLRTKIMRSGSDVDKMNVNRFEADGLTCYLLKLELHFDLCQSVEEEERKLFLASLARLNKLEASFNDYCREAIGRWRQVAKENVEFSPGSVLYQNSLKTERKLQRKVASEVCSIGFIIFSAMYAIAIGGHINTWIDILGPGEIPSWWPSLLLTNSIIVLILSCAAMWNFCEDDEVEQPPAPQPSSGGGRPGSSRSGPENGGSMLTKIYSFKSQYRFLCSSWYYKLCQKIGIKRPLAALAMLVFIACTATTCVTVGTMRAFAAANMLF
jgi:hypothetical protein